MSDVGLLREQIALVLNRLAAAPGRFASLLSRFDDADSVRGVAPGDWAPSEVLAHVRASNDILEARIFFVLVRENSPLIAYDETRWREVARYDSLPVAGSLQTMKLRRGELVRVLRAIDMEEWLRKGNHEVRGPMTVLEIAQYIANHEEEHLDQLERSVGSAGESR